jgi:hypothetical protein
VIRSAAESSTRQTFCDGPKGCGAPIVKAKAPNGGWMRLEPFPDPEGTVRVEVLTYLRVLPRFEPSNRSTKRYEPHRCVPPGKAVGRPAELTEQLAIDNDEEA